VDGLLALASDLSSAPLFPLTPDPSPVACAGEGKRALPSPLDGRRAGDEGY